MGASDGEQGLVAAALDCKREPQPLVAALTHSLCDLRQVTSCLSFPICKMEGAAFTYRPCRGRFHQCMETVDGKVQQLRLGQWLWRGGSSLGTSEGKRLESPRAEALLLT